MITILLLLWPLLLLSYSYHNIDLMTGMNKVLEHKDVITIQIEEAKKRDQTIADLRSELEQTKQEAKTNQV